MNIIPRDIKIYTTTRVMPLVYPCCNRIKTNVSRYISLNQIKKIAESENRKIGRKAAEKVSEQLNRETIRLLKKASLNAGFAGRVTIREEDIPD